MHHLEKIILYLFTASLVYNNWSRSLLIEITFKYLRNNPAERLTGEYLKLRVCQNRGRRGPFTFVSRNIAFGEARKCKMRTYGHALQYARPYFRPTANGISRRFSSAESRNRGCIFTGVLIQPETYYDRACNAALGASVI